MNEYQKKAFKMNEESGSERVEYKHTTKRRKCVLCQSNFKIGINVITVSPIMGGVKSKI